MEARAGYCRVTSCDRPIENRDTKLCASHGKALRQEVKAPIAKVSKKLQANLSNYKEASRQWLIGKRCEVFPMLKATEVHHGAGRLGKNLMDKTHWHAVSRKGHIEIEMNPAWARKMGFTVSRLKGGEIVAMTKEQHEKEHKN